MWMRMRKDEMFEETGIMEDEGKRGIL